MLIVRYLDDLRAFDYWSGAKDVADKLFETHRWNEVEALLDGVEMMSETELNDFLWFDVPDLLNLWGDNKNVGQEM